MKLTGRSAHWLLVPAMSAMGIALGSLVLPGPTRAAEACPERVCNIDTGRCVNSDVPYFCMENNVPGVGWICISLECV